MPQCVSSIPVHFHPDGDCQCAACVRRVRITFGAAVAPGAAQFPAAPGGGAERRLRRRRRRWRPTTEQAWLATLLVLGVLVLVFVLVNLDFLQLAPEHRRMSAPPEIRLIR